MSTTSLDDRSSVAADQSVPLFEDGQFKRPELLKLPEFDKKNEKPLAQPHLLKPDLCDEVEAFVNRLSEAGDLQYDVIQGQTPLLRVIEHEFASKTADHSTYARSPSPNRISDSGRYSGPIVRGAGLTFDPARCDLLYTGAPMAVDREMMWYLSHSSNTPMRLGSVFTGLPLAILSTREFHVLSTRRTLWLPSIERTLAAHAQDARLRAIERRFATSWQWAISDPVDYSFARGIGRALARREQGFVWQSARRHVGEFGPQFRNVAFVGVASRPIAHVEWHRMVRLTSNREAALRSDLNP